MGAKKSKKSKEAVFEVYSDGICYMSVCTDMTPKEAASYANVVRPTGVKSRWRISKDKKFHSGESNPCPCDRHPIERIHILFEC